MTDQHPSPQAGWYPDPTQPPDTLRYWDGTRWTDYFSVPVGPAAADMLPWYARGWRWALLGWSVILILASMANQMSDYTDASGNFYGLDSDADMIAFFVDLGMRFAFTWGLFGGWLPILAWRKRREAGLGWAG